MGLRETIARYAVRQAHALVVEVPGHWSTRVAVEREILARGWRLAESPADADVLVACGRPGPELAEALDRVWEQLPGPRARVEVVSGAGVVECLDRAGADLADLGRQRADSCNRAQEPAVGGDHSDHDGHDEDHDGDHEDHGGGHEDHGGGHEDHEDHGGGHEDHGGGHEDHAEHGDMDHGHMDHGHMDMTPGGIPLAEGGEDRDGLEMDVLHVRLGPVLPAWPAGLVLRCTLHGDLIVEAEASTVDGPPDPGEPGDDHVPGAARTCDEVARLLTLAGWQDGADHARRCRDLVLDGDPAAEASLDRLRRRVRRARLLRWSLRGLRPLSQDDLARRGLPERLAGDVHDRLLAMLHRAGAQHADPGAVADEGSPVPLDAVPELVNGLDLAAARLVVASLGLGPAMATSGSAHA